MTPEALREIPDAAHSRSVPRTDAQGKTLTSNALLPMCRRDRVRDREVTVRVFTSVFERRRSYCYDCPGERAPVVRVTAHEDFLTREYQCLGCGRRWEVTRFIGNLLPPTYRPRFVY